MKRIFIYGLAAILILLSGYIGFVGYKTSQMSFSSKPIAPEVMKFIGGEIVNGRQYAKAIDTEYYSGEEEIKEVEDAWGEPIPNYLIQIGGIDWYSWASVYHDPNDPSHIFRGEFRDKGNLYKGRFEYSHPDGMSLPNKPLQNFYMSHISSGHLIFSAIHPKDGNPENGFYHFELVPVDGSIFSSDTAEAEAYRQSRQLQDGKNK
jgi:hypothetical protein